MPIKLSFKRKICCFRNFETINYKTEKRVCLYNCPANGWEIPNQNITNRFCGQIQVAQNRTRLGMTVLSPIESAIRPS